MSHLAIGSDSHFTQVFRTATRFEAIKFIRKRNLFLSVAVSIMLRLSHACMLKSRLAGALSETIVRKATSALESSSLISNSAKVSAAAQDMIHQGIVIARGEIRDDLSSAMRKGIGLKDSIAVQLERLPFPPRK